MKFEKIAKLAAELSKSLPGSASFLCAYKPARTQVDKKLSKRTRQKYEAMVLRAKDPKVRRAWVCMTVAGLVLQGITGG